MSSLKHRGKSYMDKVTLERLCKVPSRDPRRIRRILELIRKIWRKYPTLRLMQLIGNAFPDNEDRYYTEDEILEIVLRKQYRVKP